MLSGTSDVSGRDDRPGTGLRQGQRLPFPVQGFYGIAATRQGYPDGGLRPALTGPGHDAERHSVEEEMEWLSLED